MRSIAAILFAALYLLFNTGLGINTNYCGVQVSSVELSFWDTMCCCGVEKNASDCCSTETQVYQIVEDQYNGSAPKILLAEKLTTGWSHPIQDLDKDQTSEFVWPKVPPDPGNPPTYLAYSRLILFG